MLDHVYVNNYATVTNVHYFIPSFGDHILVLLDLNLKLPNTNTPIVKRDWSHYSPQMFNNKLLSLLNRSNILLESVCVFRIGHVLVFP